MKVTVVIPTYNRCKVVQRAIASVRKQTYQDYEIVVVDDGSTDDTQQHFTESQLDACVRYVRLPYNMGVHMARNKGIDESKGSIIAFLDSDDEWFPETLATIVGIYKKYPNVGFVGAPFRTPDGEMTGVDRKSGIVPFEDFLCERNQRRIKTGIPTVRKSIIGTDRWKVKYLQFVFFRLLQLRTQIYYIAEPLGIYYPNSDSITVTKSRAIPNLQLSIVRGGVLCEYLSIMRPHYLKHCPSNMSHVSYGAGMGMLLKGDIKQAQMLLGEAARYGTRRKYQLAYLFSLIPYAHAMLRALYHWREWSRASKKAHTKTTDEAKSSKDK